MRDIKRSKGIRQKSPSESVQEKYRPVVKYVDVVTARARWRQAIELSKEEYDYDETSRVDDKRITFHMVDGVRLIKSVITGGC